MQINISEIISTDYKVQTFNPEIEMEVFYPEESGGAEGSE